MHHIQNTHMLNNCAHMDRSFSTVVLNPGLEGGTRPHMALKHMFTLPSRKYDYIVLWNVWLLCLL